jgi:hypothetical protein
MAYYTQNLKEMNILNITSNLQDRNDALISIHPILTIHAIPTHSMIKNLSKNIHTNSSECRIDKIAHHVFML